MLFAILVLIAFALWLCAAIPQTRVPEWVARAFFLAAAVVWLLPRLGAL